MLQIVPQSSAEVHATTSIMLHKDHVTMVKFGSTNDRDYQKVVGRIEDITKNYNRRQQDGRSAALPKAAPLADNRTPDRRNYGNCIRRWLDFNVLSGQLDDVETTSAAQAFVQSQEYLNWKTAAAFDFFTVRCDPGSEYSSCYDELKLNLNFQAHPMDSHSGKLYVASKISGPVMLTPLQLEYSERLDAILQSIQ